MNTNTATHIHTDMPSPSNLNLRYVDCNEIARHGFAIIPDGYLDHRDINPSISNLMIWGLSESQAAAIALFFGDQPTDQDPGPAYGQPGVMVWTVAVYSLPAETAESFSSGLGEWLEERGV